MRRHQDNRSICWSMIYVQHVHCLGFMLAKDGFRCELHEGLAYATVWVTIIPNVTHIVFPYTFPRPGTVQFESRPKRSWLKAKSNQIQNTGSLPSPSINCDLNSTPLLLIQLNQDNPCDNCSLLMLKMFWSCVNANLIIKLFACNSWWLFKSRSDLAQACFQLTTSLANTATNK